MKDVGYFVRFFFYIYVLKPEVGGVITYVFYSLGYLSRWLLCKEIELRLFYPRARAKTILIWD